MPTLRACGRYRGFSKTGLRPVVKAKPIVDAALKSSLPRRPENCMQIRFASFVTRIFIGLKLSFGGLALSDVLCCVLFPLNYWTEKSVFNH